jgi:hypothetical protein
MHRCHTAPGRVGYDDVGMAAATVGAVGQVLVGTVEVIRVRERAARTRCRGGIVVGVGLHPQTFTSSGR